MIYFDNSSTTMALNEVLEEIINVSKLNFANTSALHRLGYESEQKVVKAKKVIAKILNVAEDEIYFTSGGTESNNIAIFGVAEAYKRFGSKIITTKIEHQSVLSPFLELEKRGFEVIYLDVDNKGYIDIDNLMQNIDEQTILVSIMYVNNEIGTIQKIQQIAEKIKQKNKNTIFHTDAVQAFGKININLKNVDLMSASGHKIHSQKGIGLLYIKKGTRISNIIFGASQQKGLRPGTINTEGICGFLKALEVSYLNINESLAKVSNIKSEILKLKDLLNGVFVNGDEENGIPFILSLSFEGVKSEVLLHALEDRDIFVSTGAACSSRSKKRNSTIDFISKERADSTIRISFSPYNTLEEAKDFNKVILEIVPTLRLYKKR